MRLAAYLGINFIWKEHLSTQDLVSELAEADVFLLLSKSEAYGIADAEALSVGTPCRAAKTTALREFIEEPGCFGVENPPDPQRVARLTLYILENELEAGPFSESGRAPTLFKFTRHSIKRVKRQTPSIMDKFYILQKLK